MAFLLLFVFNMRAICYLPDQLGVVAYAAAALIARTDQSHLLLAFTVHTQRAGKEKTRG